MIKVKKLVVVLGMHRSGTSAVTRALRTVGVELGDKLIGPILGDNDKGFWEDSDINSLNEEMLSFLNLNWFSLKFLTEPELLTLKKAGFVHKAVSLVSGKIDNKTIFGIKDPRILKLMLFWEVVFSSLKCEIYYVLAIRNPLSVAESLNKRNKLPLQLGYWLWYEHVRNARNYLSNKKYIAVEYEKLIIEPLTVLKKISAFLDEDLLLEASNEYLTSFLQPKLQHGKYDYDQLLEEVSLPEAVKALYCSVAECRQNGLLDLKCSESDFNGLLTRNLDGLFSLFDELYLECVESSKMVRELSEERARVASLNHVIEDMKKHELVISNSLALHVSHVKALEAQNESYKALINSKEELNQELKVNISHISEKSKGLSLQLSQSEAKVNALQGEIELTKFDNSMLNNRISELLKSNSWRLTAPFRVISRGVRKDVIVNKVVKFCFNFAQKLPISGNVKNCIKSCVFHVAPWLFRNTMAYKRWKNLKLNKDIKKVRVDAGSNARQVIYSDQTSFLAPIKPVVKYIAFYLPQFHAIPENDKWWGKGFTEWTNVRAALPQFDGHYQPRVPEKLGYYNLLEENVFSEQIELARSHGLGGFCFYYYWFAGKRLLEQPLDKYLNDKSYSFPFCICWANENWSRRWDGKDSEILISQDHSPSDDFDVARDLIRYLQDPRYIKVEGKPLIIIYRPSLLPNSAETAQRWRELFRASGIGEIYLCYVQSFEKSDPTSFGFDAAIEFPPNNFSPKEITQDFAHSGTSFSGVVYDYRSLLESAKEQDCPDFPLFRGICPSWDNTARRKCKSTVFQHSHPTLFRKWADETVRWNLKNKQQHERIVFVNAWNEWAEGAYLEPDTRYKYAWLNALRDSLNGPSLGGRTTSVAVVVHDGHPHGAQYLALGMVKILSSVFKLDVHVVLLEDGVLLSRFEEFATVYRIWEEEYRTGDRDVMNELLDSGVSAAIFNSLASAGHVERFRNCGFDTVVLVHELPGVISGSGLTLNAQLSARCSDLIVFPSEFVHHRFTEVIKDITAPNKILPQGLWRRNQNYLNKISVRKSLRSRLGIPQDAFMILGVGYGDFRKGVDFFAKMGIDILTRRKDFVFVWVGHWDDVASTTFDEIVSPLKQHFFKIGFCEETPEFHLASDVYALTSREDPFPNVVLESFDAGVPVVAFDGTGGGAELAKKLCDFNASQWDVSEFASRIEELISDQERLDIVGRRCRSAIEKNFSMDLYLLTLLSELKIQLPKLSVVVPNYNYAQYLEKRLDSIVKQSIYIYELIFLDDASSDSSVAKAEEWAANNNIRFRVVTNAENSGNVFAQWKKGVELAKGDFVWIAEADDLCSPRFVENALSPMYYDKDVVLSYAESKQIDSQDNVCAENYAAYLSDVNHTKWNSSYIIEGIEEIRTALAIKNTIPNVSAVIFRKTALIEALRDDFSQCVSNDMAGDWIIYVSVLRRGKVAFCSEPLNLHRRHNKSVIGRANLRKLVEQVQYVQSWIAKEYKIEFEVSKKAEYFLSEIRSKIN